MEEAKKFVEKTPGSDIFIRGDNMSRVLVADDEEQILSVMMDVLEEAGHQVIGVKEGEEAYNRLQKERFDVALLDVMMPKMDGYHLATKIHGLPKPPRIVIVTSRNYDRDEGTIQNVGVDAFLPKPFSNRDLIEVVARLVKKRRRK